LKEEFDSPMDYYDLHLSLRGMRIYAFLFLGRCLTAGNKKGGLRGRHNVLKRAFKMEGSHLGKK
jgi:hypothetical protein